jgi:N-ethylmaleimide reductase
LSEVLDVLIGVYTASRVGVRFSPTGRYNDMYDDNPNELMKHALKIC